MRLWSTDNLDSHTPLPPASEADDTSREHLVVDTLAWLGLTWASVLGSLPSPRWMTLPYGDALCSCGDVGQFRNEEALGGLALDGLPSTIIALGRRHVRMTR